MQQSAIRLLACSLMILPACAQNDNADSKSSPKTASTTRNDLTKPDQTSQDTRVKDVSNPTDAIAEKPRQLIIGQWEVAEGPLKGKFLEFTRDGKVNYTKGGKKPPLPDKPTPADLLNAATIYQYKFVSDSAIQLDAMVPAALASLSGGRTPTVEESKKLQQLTKDGALTCVKSDKLNIIVSKNELTLQDPGRKDQVMKLKRIK
jgi:hypothetical protein